MFHVFKRPILTTSIRSMSDRAHGKHRTYCECTKYGIYQEGQWRARRLCAHFRVVRKF